MGRLDTGHPAIAGVVLALAGAILCACFNPGLDVSCGVDGLCPAGLACVNTLCVDPIDTAADATVPPTSDGSIVQSDAGTDAIAAPACATNALYDQTFQNSSYRLEATTADWQSSRQRCLDDGADLLIIEDASENDFLRSVYLPTVEGWIGLRSNNDTLTWVDGTELANGEYENFRTAPAATSCITWRHSGVATGQWFSRDCDNLELAFCECALTP